MVDIVLNHHELYIMVDNMVHFRMQLDLDFLLLDGLHHLIVVYKYMIIIQ